MDYEQEEVEEFEPIASLYDHDIREEIENLDDDIGKLTRRRETLTKELAKREAERCLKSTTKQK